MLPRWRGITVLPWLLAKPNGNDETKQLQEPATSDATPKGRGSEHYLSHKNSGGNVDGKEETALSSFCAIISKKVEKRHARIFELGRLQNQ